MSGRQESAVSFYVQGLASECCVVCECMHACVGRFCGRMGRLASALHPRQCGRGALRRGRRRRLHVRGRRLLSRLLRTSRVTLRLGAGVVLSDAQLTPASRGASRGAAVARAARPWSRVWTSGPAHARGPDDPERVRR